MARPQRPRSQHPGWGPRPPPPRGRGLHSPRSTSHSGDEAPLHSLRGPSPGNSTPNSDRDTGLGRSRLAGRTAAGNCSGVSDGLVGPELKLDRDWVSESSSDTKALQLSSSKASEATGRGEKEEPSLRSDRGPPSPRHTSGHPRCGDGARPLQDPATGPEKRAVGLLSSQAQTPEHPGGRRLDPPAARGLNVTLQPLSQESPLPDTA